MPKFRASEGGEARYSSFVTIDELEFLTNYRLLDAEQRMFFDEFMKTVTRKNQQANPPNVVALRQ